MVTMAFGARQSVLLAKSQLIGCHFGIARVFAMTETD